MRRCGISGSLILILLIGVFLSGCTLLKRGKKVEAEHTKLAIEHYLAGKHEEAIKECRKAIKANPGDIKARYYLGCAYAKKENFKAAREEFEEVVKIDPNSQEAKLAQSDWLPGLPQAKPGEEVKEERAVTPEGMPPPKEEVIRKAIIQRLQTLPKPKIERKSDANKYYLLGVKDSRRGKWDLAIARLEKANELDSDYALVYTELGIAYAKKGMFDKAITVLQMATQKDPDNLVAHYNLGAIYEGKGMWSQAISEYMKTISLDPNNVVVHTRLGVCFVESGQNAAAMDQWNIAVTLDPNYKEAQCLLGKIYADTGEAPFVEVRYKLTYEESTHTLKYERETVETKITIAGGEPTEALVPTFFDAAIRQYKRAAEVDPSYAKAHNGLGTTYARAAQKDLRVFYTDNKEHRDPYDGRLRLKMSISEMWDKACYHLRQAAKLDPQHAYIRCNLGVVYGEMGLYNQAIKELKTALKINPKLTAAQANLAIIHSYQGAEGLARAGYKKISKVEPRKVRAQESLRLLQPEITPEAQPYPLKGGIPLTPPGTVYPGAIPTPPGGG